MTTGLPRWPAIVWSWRGSPTSRTVRRLGWGLPSSGLEETLSSKWWTTSSLSTTLLSPPLWPGSRSGPTHSCTGQSCHHADFVNFFPHNLTQPMGLEAVNVAFEWTFGVMNANSLWYQPFDVQLEGEGIKGLCELLFLQLRSDIFLKAQATSNNLETKKIHSKKVSHTCPFYWQGLYRSDCF